MSGSRLVQVQQLRQFSKRAGSMDKVIRKELVKEAKTILKPTLTEIKRKVRASPSHQTAKSRGGRPKLRGEIAKVVKSKGQASSAGFKADIWVASAKMPSPRQNLPLLMDGAGSTKWRYPVFPKPSQGAGEWTWRSQRPRPFFYPVIDKNAPPLLDKIHEAVAQAVAKHLRG